MNRTIEDATVKRYRYDNHDQLRNTPRRLETLGGLTPCECIRKVWTSKLDRFILNPIHQMSGLDT